MSSDHERYEHLVVKAVDGALSEHDQAELDAHLGDCRECTAELADFKIIKETTDTMTSRILTDARIEAPRLTGASRTVVTGSYMLLLVSALLLLGFAGYTLMADGDVPTIVKVGTGAGALGAFGLFAYALWIRIRAAGRDPYEEIDL